MLTGLLEVYMNINNFHYHVRRFNLVRIFCLLSWKKNCIVSTKLRLPTYFISKQETWKAVVRRRRNSHLQIFFKICLLKLLGIFTIKSLCWSLPLIKLQALRPVTLLKKTLTWVFSCEYCKILKNSFFIEHLK